MAPRRANDPDDSSTRTLGWWVAVARLFRQRRREHARGSDFRTTSPDEVKSAYGSMSEREFADINAPQDWINRRVIPHLVRLLDRPGPWRIVDLGCGTGGSTRILAHLAPTGSTIDAYDLAEDLLVHARRHLYVNARGDQVTTSFHCQSIAIELRAGNKPIPPRSVDLAHSAGVVGHHLDSEATDRMLQELARILADGGYALLDSGPRLRGRQLSRLARRLGFELVARRQVPLLGPRVQLLFQLGRARGA